MLDKIKVGGVYLNNDEIKIEVLFVNSESVFYKRCGIGTHGWSEVAYALTNWTKPKEKWFRVTYFHKKEDRPCCPEYLYRSEKEFLDFDSTKKEDYHWIKLEQISI